MRELQRWEFKRYYGGLGGGDMEQVGGVGLLPLGCGVEWVKADEAEGQELPATTNWKKDVTCKNCLRALEKGKSE